MSPRNSKRYCAAPEALAAMKRDGLGWGHDLDCGCFHVTAPSNQPSGIARVMSIFKRKT